MSTAILYDIYIRDILLPVLHYMNMFHMVTYGFRELGLYVV